MQPEQDHRSGASISRRVRAFSRQQFAPVRDRDVAGRGFNHKRDDIVTVAAPQLGQLVNRMRISHECEPWTFGVAALMKNLAKWGIL
jgi:fumarylacetoacetate (FAA) hydrolase family protein